MPTPKRASGSKVTKLAAKVLQGYAPTPVEARSLAASVLSQAEKISNISKLVGKQ